MKLDAKIAAILSDTSIVITAGEMRGVSAGDKVVIWEDREILDPDTQDLLGVVRINLASAEVTEVQEKISVAETARESQLSSIIFTVRPPVRRFTTRPPTNENEVRVQIGQVITVIISDSEESNDA